MKIGLLDVDRKMPNIALMKLSAYHKQQGDTTFLNPTFQVDLIYASCVFDWNAKKIQEPIDGTPLIVGGFGVSQERLPNHIEHMIPDYSLYGIDYSMGFTTRGCFRRCPFCNIPQIEGDLKEWAFITEFLHPKHRKVILLDYQFLGSQKWRDKLLFLIKWGGEVNFCQGVDVRIITDDMAKLLSHIKYRTHTFKEKRIHIAWDQMKDEQLVMRGIERLQAYGVKPISCYGLIGFDTSIEDDLYRFHRLREKDVDLFPMLYNNKADSLRRHFARWGSKPWLYKTIPFSQYSHLTPSQRVRVSQL